MDDIVLVRSTIKFRLLLKGVICFFYLLIFHAIALIDLLKGSNKVFLGSLSIIDNDTLMHKTCVVHGESAKRK